MFSSVTRKILSVTNRRFFSVDKVKFRQAVAAVQSAPPAGFAKKDVNNDTKLRLYALFKYIEQGPVTGSRPSIFDMVGRAKYDAWASLGSKTPEAAMEEYIALVTDIYHGKLPEFDLSAMKPETKVSETAEVTTSVDATPKYRTLQEIAFPRSTSEKMTYPFDMMKVNVVEGVANVKINRPKRGNAYNIELWEQTYHTWQRLSKDADVRVVVLSGEGANFSTGMDLTVFTDLNSMLEKQTTCEGRKREGIMHFIEYLQNVISAPEECPVPVIAAIHGNCIGGAIDMICAADIRYCTKDAIFCVKETDLAIVADIGTLQRLPKLIGHSAAAELTYTARTFNGEEAVALGLAQRCFDTQEEMMAAVAKTASEISSKSPLTIRGVKKTLLAARDGTVREGLQQVKMLNSSTILSNDLINAATALMQKKTPTFPDA